MNSERAVRVVSSWHGSNGKGRVFSQGPGVGRPSGGHRGRLPLPRTSLVRVRSALDFGEMALASRGIAVSLEMEKPSRSHDAGSAGCFVLFSATQVGKQVAK